MKNIIEYLNTNIIEITEATAEQNAIGAVKALKDGMDNAIRVYMTNHKPTDTIRDYINAVSKTLEAGLKISLSKIFSVDKIKKIVSTFVDSAEREMKKYSFNDNTLFDEFIKKKLIY